MNQTPSRDFPALIRDVPDFPKPGIRFKDITPLLADPEGFAWVVDTLAVPWRASRVDCVVGIEARGQTALPRAEPEAPRGMNDPYWTLIASRTP